MPTFKNEMFITVQHSDEYWSTHFRAQIAERSDLQRALAEEGASNPKG